MLKKARLFIYIMIPIILISGGWGLFNRFIRPNHYQLLFPYSMFMFRDDNMTGTRIGCDNKAEIKIPAGYALAGKNEKAEKLMFDEFWIDQTQNRIACGTVDALGTGLCAGGFFVHRKLRCPLVACCRDCHRH